MDLVKNIDELTHCWREILFLKHVSRNQAKTLLKKTETEYVLKLKRIALISQNQKKTSLKRPEVVLKLKLTALTSRNQSKTLLKSAEVFLKLKRTPLIILVKMVFSRLLKFFFRAKSNWIMKLRTQKSS